jgi:hypothetical protein
MICFARRALLFVFLCLSVPVAGAGAAAAQEPEPATRAEALRQERAHKQQQLAPNRPNGLQRGLDYVENRGLFLVARDGFHPVVRTLTTGSGWGFGAGYRNRAVFADEGTLALWTAGTLKKYWAMEGRATFPSLAGGRVMAEGVATVREYPREAFFGLGPDSRRDRASSFLLRQSRLSAQAGVRVAPPLTVGGGVALFMPRTGRGRDGGVPSIDQEFDPAETPGLGARVNFLETSGFVELDYRRPLNARRGGFYRVDVSRFADPDDTWTFNRTEVDLRQYIGFLNARRVIALHAFLSTSDAPAGSAVPFFLMPSLGGNDTLRGFRNYRFRGPHALLLQAEYRWEIWSALEAALFYDAGKVAMRRGDLDFRNLQDDYGFGFRFNTANAVVLRVDAAFGSRDGKHLHITLSGVF